MLTPVELVMTELAEIVKKHALSSFTYSWRLTLQDLLVTRNSA